LGSIVAQPPATSPRANIAKPLRNLEVKNVWHQLVLVGRLLFDEAIRL